MAIKTLCFLCVCAGAAPTRYLAPAAAGAPKEANARPLSNLKLTLNVSDLFLRGPPEKFILSSVHIECVEDGRVCRRPEQASGSARAQLAYPFIPSARFSLPRRCVSSYTLPGMSTKPFKSMMDEIMARPKDFKSYSKAQRTIDGQYGPEQLGVVRYPYSTSERLYKNDFRAIVSNRLTHPYCLTCKKGAGSIPFNILSGSNFDDDKVNAAANWISEQERSYVLKSLTAGKSIEPTGIRTECSFIG